MSSTLRAMSDSSFDDEDNYEDGYAKLSEMYTKSIDSYYDDPSDVLNKHPYSNIGNKYTMQQSQLNIKHYRPPLPKLELNDNAFPTLVSPNEYDAAEPPPTLTPLVLSSFSDSEEEEEEFEPTIIAAQRRRQRAETGIIDIIGSLCLQGVLQGIEPNDESESTMRRILPDSIQMTANLEKHSSELDELSVMVTKNLEIVPETPYDPNSGTAKTKASLSKTDPNVKLRPKLQVAERAQSVAKIETRPTSVTYINNIVRPQPLPPMSDSSSNIEKKKFRVVETLVESEAAFLTSLNIAIEIYKKPLLSTAGADISVEDIKHLFGPIIPLLEHHELFYAALSEQTKEWSPVNQIGDIFLASFHRKDVIKHYRKYVINFSTAMSILQKAIKKKPRFYDFLKRQLPSSGSALSLQALLLKPIQRFPQYLLFLQDLIKYTPVAHPDRDFLEMAQAHIEGIASYLNEAKKKAEQQIIVQHFSSRIEKMPSLILKSDQTLIRQDVIQWMTFKNGKWQSKERYLFLFDTVLVCCSVKIPVRKKRKSQSEVSLRSLKIEADQVISGEAPRLVCKWICYIPLLEITEPDYIKNNIPIITVNNQEVETELIQKFQEVQLELKNLNHDFQVLANIAGLVSTLNNTYTTLTSENVNNHCRVLQRKLEAGHELVRSCEPRRADIIIHSKTNRTDITERLHQVLMFESEKIKQDWITDVRLGKLRQNLVNKLTWVTDEQDTEEIDAPDDEDDIQEYEKFVPKETLPLVIDCMRLSHHDSDVTTVECATPVGNDKIWFATGTSNVSYVSVVRCLTPYPALVETFPVSSSKILCMNTISSSESLTVWIGTQCGKLMLFDAVSKKCLQGVQLPDSVLCIEKFRNRTFIGTANGHVFVYTRPKGEKWNIQKCNHDIPVSSDAIQCFCTVDDKLWIGVKSSITILDMSTLQLEHSIKVMPNDTKYVKRMQRSGTGVWVTLSREATMFLFHKDTRKPVQEIDIKGSLYNIISYANISDKFDSLSGLHITALFALDGYLWVGCSTGAILVYQTPRGLPISTRRPLLASDGHKGTVRVIVGLQAKIDNSSARFDQFVLEERERMIGSFEPVNNEAKTMEAQSGRGLEITTGGEATGTDQSVDKSDLPRVSQVIKKLELGKLLFQGSPLPVPRSKSVPQKPIPKPRQKINKKKEPVNEPAEYEVPQTQLPIEEHDYDEVPIEDEIRDELEDEPENEPEQNEDTGGIPRSQSDVAMIGPSKYERSMISVGNSLYEPIQLSSILFNIPEHTPPTSDHTSTFVFTGGLGLSNFRPTSTGHSSLLNQAMGLTEHNIPLNSGQNFDDFPCVISYQIPHIGSSK